MKQPGMETVLRDYLKRSNIEESSVEVLKRSVRWFIEMHGDIKPQDVTFSHVDDFRAWLRKGRSGSTANTYMAMIKGIFRWLRDRGDIRSNPFDGVKRYGTSAKNYDIYKPDEIRRVLRVADLRWKTIVCLALCSMRRAEILNLHVSDIDFERNEIRIIGKIKSPISWPWSIKNHNEALVGINEMIAKMLIELIEQLAGKQPYIVLKERYWKRNLEKQEAGTLTHALRNCPWGNFTRDFRSLLKRARVPAKRFHDLRRTFANNIYQDGFSLIDLKYLMRHASIQTTELYIKKIEERKLISQSGRTFRKYYETLVP